MEHLVNLDGYEIHEVYRDAFKLVVIETALDKHPDLAKLSATERQQILTDVCQQCYEEILALQAQGSFWGTLAGLILES